VPTDAARHHRVGDHELDIVQELERISQVKAARR
jgi:hypothetical protein